MSTNIRPINAELRKIVDEKLHDVEARIPADIAALREWVVRQPHLRARTDEQFLAGFLRGCKYSLEKAKSKLDYFYTIKTMMPELFGGLQMDEHYVKLCRSGSYVRLPKPLGAGGPRIQLTNYAKFDEKQFKLSEMIRFQCMVLELQIIEDDNCMISGYVEIIDMSNFSLSLLAQVDLILVKKIVVFAEKAAPKRMKGVHFINCPKEAAALLNVAKSLMSKKLQARFYIHKTMDDLYEYVDRDYLPYEYGGTNGTIPEIQAETEAKLLALNAYLSEEEKFGVDEKLRVGKELTTETIFGIEGSFRKLNID